MGSRPVYCQRLFRSRHGSQYFQVQPPEDSEGPNTVPVNGDAAWARVGAEMAKAWERVKKQAQSTIQEGERNELNPWVDRTQWLPYLVGIERANLMACIEDRLDNKQASKREAHMFACLQI
jgi:hypothetical protein